MDSRVEAVEPVPVLPKKRLVRRVAERGVFDIIAFTDGSAFWQDPKRQRGPAGVGFVICDGNGQQLCERSEFVGLASADEAEIEAIVRALRQAREFSKGGRVLICTDSRDAEGLLLERFRTKIPCKQKKVRKFLDLTRDFNCVTLKMIPRTRNHQAHGLAKRAVRRSAAWKCLQQAANQ